jgi:hypothetical protein
MSRKAVAPPAELRLGGVTHIIKIDFNALAAMEEQAGRSVMEFGTWKQISLKDLRTMIWASMLFGDPSITQEQVGRMIHPGNMARVMTVIVETWKKSVPASVGSPSPFVATSQ